MHRFWPIYATRRHSTQRSAAKLARMGSEVGSEFVIEIGVALIGAAVTACLLGSLVNRQQGNAKQWRKQLRRWIRALEKSRQG